MALLFLVCHLWLDSLISGLVSYDLSLASMVLRLSFSITDILLTLVSHFCFCLSQFYYDLNFIFPVLSPLLDLPISGLVVYNLTFIFLVLSPLLEQWTSYFWSGHLWLVPILNGHKILSYTNIKLPQFSNIVRSYFEQFLLIKYFAIHFDLEASNKICKINLFLNGYMPCLNIVNISSSEPFKSNILSWHH